MLEPKLDIRHERIISEIEKVSTEQEVLNVGCGDCKTDYHLIKKGYQVYSTDYTRASHFDDVMEEYFDTLNYSTANIFDLNSYPVETSEIVMCCEVLEHLVDYEQAFRNLLNLTRKRLIIGVPWKRSFNMPGPPPTGHCNWWHDENENSEFKSIYEFKEMCKPYNFYVEKILTKQKDIQMNQRSYLIIIDK